MLEDAFKTGAKVGIRASRQILSRLLDTDAFFFVRRRMAIEFASKVAVHTFVDVHVQAFVSWNMWLKYVAWLCGV